MSKEASKEVELPFELLSDVTFDASARLRHVKGAADCKQISDSSTYENWLEMFAEKGYEKRKRFISTWSSSIQEVRIGCLPEPDCRTLVARCVFQLRRWSGRNGILCYYAVRPEYRKEDAKEDNAVKKQ